ncbi:uncharacterized protein [Amphiura filiformis]|uniref:uncharacterized protein isoform X1 n=2 Tax=Amphiura filiformis TaxID=82378 RepID=UPI003B217066
MTLRLVSSFIDQYFCAERFSNHLSSTMYFSIVYFPSDNSLYVCNNKEIGLINKDKPKLGQSVFKNFFVDHENDPPDGKFYRTSDPFEGFVIYEDELKKHCNAKLELFEEEVGKILEIDDNAVRVKTHMLGFGQAEMGKKSSVKRNVNRDKFVAALANERTGSTNMSSAGPSKGTEKEDNNTRAGSSQLHTNAQNNGRKRTHAPGKENAGNQENCVKKQNTGAAIRKAKKEEKIATAHEASKQAKALIEQIKKSNSSSPPSLVTNATPIVHAPPPPHSLATNSSSVTTAIVHAPPPPRSLATNSSSVTTAIVHAPPPPPSLANNSSSVTTAIVHAPPPPRSLATNSSSVTTAIVHAPPPPHSLATNSSSVTTPIVHAPPPPRSLATNSSSVTTAIVHAPPPPHSLATNSSSVTTAIVHAPPPPHSLATNSSSVTTAIKYAPLPYVSQPATISFPSTSSSTSLTPNLDTATTLLALSTSNPTQIMHVPPLPNLTHAPPASAIPLSSPPTKYPSHQLPNLTPSPLTPLIPASIMSSLPSNVPSPPISELLRSVNGDLFPQQEDCIECFTKEGEIERLRQEVRERDEEIERLREEVIVAAESREDVIQRLEEELDAARNRRGNAEIRAAVGAPPVHQIPLNDDDVYQPRRGPKINKCIYRILQQGEPCPAGYDQIENSSLSVPTEWLAQILSENKAKSRSHTFKKILESFFEPDEMGGRNSTSMTKNFPEIMNPLRLFAINQLKIQPSDLTRYINQKCNSMSRSNRRQKVSIELSLL